MTAAISASSAIRPPLLASRQVPFPPNPQPPAKIVTIRYCGSASSHHLTSTRPRDHQQPLDQPEPPAHSRIQLSVETRGIRLGVHCEPPPQRPSHLRPAQTRPASPSSDASMAAVQGQTSPAVRTAGRTRFGLARRGAIARTGRARWPPAGAARSPGERRTAVRGPRCLTSRASGTAVPVRAAGPRRTLRYPLWEGRSS